MRFSLFNGNWELSHKVAVGATFTSFVLGFVVLVQAVTIANKDERVVVVPPTVDQAYQIQYDNANVEYYQSMAVFIAGIIGQTTPSNMENTTKTLNQFLTPALQRQVNESLNALANKLPKDNFSSWFLPKNTFYEAQTGKIFVQGTLQSSLVGSKILDQNVVYEFIIKMNAGKPVVTFFNSYEGTKPRTLAFIRAEQALEQQRAKQGQ